MRKTNRWWAASVPRAVSAIVIALAGVQATSGRSTAPVAASLQPTGPWVLDGEGGECLLQRTYAVGKSELTMALRPEPYGGDTTLLIVEKGDFPLGVHGGHLMLAPSERGLETNVLGDRLSDGRIAIRITAKGDDSLTLDMLDGAQAMTITIGHFSRILATPGMARAVRALTQCDRTLIQSWGLDPDEGQRIKVAAKPLGEPRNWVAPSAYPSSALATGLQGNTRILYTIGVDGRAVDCRVVIGSGNKELDAAGCRSVTANARYEPARDSHGRAVASHDTATIYWRMGL